MRTTILLVLLLFAFVSVACASERAVGYAVKDAQPLNATAQVCCAFDYHGALRTCAAIAGNDCAACLHVCTTYGTATP
jgi:hypothetical protein